MVSLLICVIVVAIIFDYINGFHDAANAIATVVSTGVLPIRTAVMLAGLLNFFGAITGTAVATTIAKGFADPADVTQAVVLAGLVLQHPGADHSKWTALKQKVPTPLLASPPIGFVVAFILMILLVWT